MRNDVRLEASDHGTFLLRHIPTNRILVVYRNTDFPGVASNLGFKPCTKCDDTDGTVDCKHYTAIDMINNAREFLDNHIEETFDDPGYFD